MTTHHQTGILGEEKAAQYLEEKGYEIMERNYHAGNYEIDLIAKKNFVLAFVEVKTRTSTHYGEPETFVTIQKQQNIINAAQRYIEKKNRTEEARFDIIAITVNNGNITINHIEDAYRSSWKR